MPSWTKELDAQEGKAIWSCADVGNGMNNMHELLISELKHLDLSETVAFNLKAYGGKSGWLCFHIVF